MLDLINSIELVSCSSLSQALNSAILAHFRDHPFFRSQLKLPFLIEIAGGSELSTGPLLALLALSSERAATPVLWELHGPVGKARRGVPATPTLWELHSPAGRVWEPHSATPCVLSWYAFTYCTYIPSLYCTTRPFTHVYRTYFGLS